MQEENFEIEVYTLTDDEGNESEYELIGSLEIDGQTYVALIPVEEDDEESDEDNYVILKVTKEDDEEVFVTIDDDEEFDRVADVFEEEIFNSFDHDMLSESEEDEDEDE